MSKPIMTQALITPHYLQQSFPGYDLDWLKVQEKLRLDLAHIQLLRDFQAEWIEPDPQLLLALLYLVDAVNQGSLCLMLNDIDLNTHAKQLNLEVIENHINGLNLHEFKLYSEAILIVDNGAMYFAKYFHQQTSLQNYLSDLIANNQVNKFAHEKIKEQVSAVVNNLPYDLENLQVQALLTALLQPFSIISGGPGTGKTTILLSLIRVLFRLGVKLEEIILAAPTGRAANRMTESIESGLMTLDYQQDLSIDDFQNVNATTIHRLLGANPNQTSNRYHTNNWLPYEVVVVDEVSMVDLALMNQLIQAISPRTRLIFLGDQFQLPSVQSGALLADLMPPIGHDELNTAEFLKGLVDIWPNVKSVAKPDNDTFIKAQATTDKPQLLTDKITLLQTSKRCQEHIAKLSEQVRQGDVDMFFSEVMMFDQSTCDDTTQVLKTEGVYWQVHSTEQGTWLRLCKSWFKKYFQQHPNSTQSYVALVRALRYQDFPINADLTGLLNPVFDLIKSQRILSLSHQGPTGTKQVNTLIANWLKKDLQIKNTTDCFHGAIIMINRNEATLGLFNGDVGLVLEVAPEQFQVVFEKMDSYQVFSIHLIPNYDLAFSMTVHKSQGSEFRHILMLLTEQLDSPLLSREIVYTGMTRAKQSVLIYGSDTALRQAITHKTTRNSGLSFWSGK